MERNISNRNMERQCGKSLVYRCEQKRKKDILTAKLVIICLLSLVSVYCYFGYDTYHTLLIRERTQDLSNIAFVYKAVGLGSLCISSCWALLLSSPFFFGEETQFKLTDLNVNKIMWKK